MKNYLIRKVQNDNTTTTQLTSAVNDEAIFEIAEGVLASTQGLASIEIFAYVGSVNRVSVVQRNVYDGSNESDGKTQ